MDLSFLPPEFSPAMKVVGGALLFLIGVSYGYKFVRASFLGKVNYWSGFDHFGWIFAPFTMLVTPFLCHTPANGKTLIKTKDAAWVHLLWGPVFFMSSLMCMVAGADFMGLPGTSAMNYILTFGRMDVPPAITYSPPFTYKFPFLANAQKTILEMATTKMDWDDTKYGVLDKSKKANNNVSTPPPETNQANESDPGKAN